MLIGTPREPYSTEANGCRAGEPVEVAVDTVAVGAGVVGSAGDDDGAGDAGSAGDDDSARDDDSAGDDDSADASAVAELEDELEVEDAWAPGEV